MTGHICNLCSRKLANHTYAESLDCAMKLIKAVEGRQEFHSINLDSQCHKNFLYLCII